MSVSPKKIKARNQECLFTTPKKLTRSLQEYKQSLKGIEQGKNMEHKSIETILFASTLSLSSTKRTTKALQLREKQKQECSSLSILKNFTEKILKKQIFPCRQTNKMPKKISQDIILKQHQLPKEVVELYRAKQSQKTGKVNYTHGYIEPLKCLYFSIQKQLILYNPNKQIFKGKNSKFILSDILVNIFSTDFIINSEIQGNLRILIFTHPWYLELYGMQDKEQGIIKLHLKYRTEVQHVTDLVCTQQGVVFYISKNKIHTINFAQNCKNYSLQRMLSTSKTVMPKLTSFINRLTLNLCSLIPRCTKQEYRGIKYDQKNNVILVLGERKEERKRFSFLSKFLVSGDELIQKEVIQESSLLGGKSGRIMDFFVNEKEISIFVEDGRYIRYDQERKLSVLIDTISPFPLNHILRAEIALFLSTQNLKIHNSVVNSIPHSIQGTQHKLYYFPSSFTNPHLCIHITNENLFEIVILRKIDIVYELVFDDRLGIGQSLGLDRVRQRVVQIIGNQKQVIRVLFDIVCNEGKIKYYYKHKDNLHAFENKQLTSIAHKFLTNCLSNTEKTQLDFSIYTQFLNTKLTINTHQEKPFSLENHDLTSVDMMWACAIMDTLVDRLGQCMKKKINEVNLLGLLEELENLRKLVDFLSEPVRVILYPIMNPLIQYLVVLDMIETTTIIFEQGLLHPQILEPLIFTYYTEQFEPQLQEKMVIIVPAYMSERLKFTFQLFRQVHPMNRTKILKRIDQLEDIPDFFLAYLEKNKGINLQHVVG